ncbi:mechanosensitive ion channel domain-containing protein [Limimaricola hongkongensis]|uniref:Potassium efflux system KefA protein / Small-conductance mechanosensitive channel n=1 Tax=Limimaricola hongkongensis DSM 17492 TaxID=1122180 RepID=A0A017H7Y8_9RHOB|nr:mechanosensitive ion channel domain-containing protein [Limimaricola hongkongensis]EYD70420.1 Potassium efflux system KefA protein / Small-conductance mechanosensitive channel [Limimaricola hongkongensis DSM 17492]
MPRLLAYLLPVFALMLGLLLSLAAPGGAQAQILPAQATAEEGDAAAAAAEPGPLSTLLEVLRDETGRNALIAELERVTTGAGPVDQLEAVAEEVQQVEPRLSIGARIAQTTQSIAEGLAAQADQVVRSFSGNGNLLGGLASLDLPVLWETFQSLILVIVITVAVWLGLRAMVTPVYRRLGERAEQANFLRMIFLFIGSTALDAAVVVAAWALGYAISLLALGEYAEVGFRQALYLNAFLLVELVKVAIRAIVSPATGGLRLVNLSNSAAQRLNRHVNVVVSVLGYGQLLVVPLVNRNISFTAGLGVSALLSVFVLVYLVALVVRHRANVANWIARRLMAERVEEESDAPEETPEETPETAPAAAVAATGGPADARPARKQLGGMLGTLTRTWHWFALTYLGFMFVVVISRSGEVVADYLIGSGKVLAAALIGSLVIGAIGRGLRHGVVLPDEMRRKLPLLEPRLNAIVPKLLITLRLLVSLAVILFTLDVIGLFDLGGWFASPAGLEVSGRVVSVVLILLVAAAIWLAVNSWIDYRLNAEVGRVPTARETTLLTLLRNAFAIALLIFTLMFALAEIGLDIGPLLASAGVLGLAIGFGAQKLVQDIITGVFIQFENAMNVGDVVTVGGTTGVVEKLTVRSVSLRDVQGTFHIIPFSSVDMVSNFMRDFSYFVCDMGIAYREDVEEAKQAMFDAFEELKTDPEQKMNIIGDLEWFGLNSFGDSAVVVRARIKTVPGTQWGLGRAYNGILKRIFDARGIEIPFPHQTIFFGEAKDGRTQALRLRQVEDGASGPDTGADTGADTGPKTGGDAS